MYITNWNLHYLMIFLPKLQLYLPNGFLRIRFSKIFLSKCLCKNLTPPPPHHGLTFPPGIIIWPNSNLHYLRKLQHKFQLYWPKNYKKIFEKKIHGMQLNLSPFKEGMTLHWNKPISPSPNKALCSVWLKLARWFWGRRWKGEKFTLTSNNLESVVSGNAHKS